MQRDRSLRSFLLASVSGVPADLAAVVAVVALLWVAVFVPGVRETPLRVVVGLPFALFVPGYAFVAALFPEADASSVAETEGEDGTDGGRTLVARSGGGITGLERVALSFGTSIAIVPLIGLALNFTPWGIRLAPVAFSVGGFAILAAWVAGVRRAELPEDERFAVPYRRWLAAARADLFEPDTRTDAALNVLLVVSVLLATASVTYAVAVPNQGESFTEFYLLTENETGDLVADDYPTDLTRGEGESLRVGIGNHEHRSMNYSVVVLLQRVEMRNNSTRVLEEAELHRYRASVGSNETSLTEYDVVPTMTGERLRLQFLLYTDGPPSEPTQSNAYRELHLWVNVSDPSTQTDRPPI